MPASDMSYLVSRIHKYIPDGGIEGMIAGGASQTNQLVCLFCFICWVLPEV